MLKTLDGELITHVPREEDFEDVLNRLGTKRANEIRDELDRVVGQFHAGKNGKRSFGSSALGSQLAPWKSPLTHITDVAKQIEGQSASQEDIEERSSWIFGLFVWERIMKREEEWRFYDPNLGRNDPNREITGKVYFEC